MSIRIATFNCENLFARYRFRSNIPPTGRDEFSINDLAFQIHDEDSKRITGRIIRDLNADVICFQEVENLLVMEEHEQLELSKTMLELG